MTLSEIAGGKILGGREGAVGRLILNNPERHNALSLDMWEGGADLVEQMAADPDTRLLVISGAGGKAFAAGADISKFEEERSTPEAVEHYKETNSRFYAAVTNFPKPVIAKINGYCIGGGLALAICCDLRICEEGARFAVPAARLGLGYGYDGIRQLAHIVGPSMAAEIFYTARQFSSAEAYDMGLVNRVVPADELEAYVEDYAARIAENAPMTIAGVKATKLAIEADPDQRDLKAIEDMVKACFESEDYIEGRRAFMEKRKPKFIGR